MKQLLTHLGDLLFPPTAEVQHLRTISEEAIYNCYKPHRNDWFISLSQYQHPTISAAIRAHKFQHYRPARDIFVSFMDTWLTSLTQQPLLIPIPLHPIRERERGYNQVSAVLECCTTPCEIVPVLKRITNTTPQTKLDKTARHKNVSQVFATTKHTKRITAGSHVVLVDDVVSTGATMKAARASLAPHLPSNCTITCLAFAH